LLECVSNRTDGGSRLARFAARWLLLIAIATVGAYLETNALLAARTAGDGYSMQALSGGDLAACARAARLLVAVTGGTNSAALPDERRNFERSTAVTRRACPAG
jgi:hypothetical protein